ncbi:MAG TPA: hypothetical protein VH141_00160 [Pseudonocardia sp.]|jgi:hypothetical protein|nr:hypothetical protein [Pseudonocardia sp.]
MGSSPYLLVLFIGAVIVLVDGQLILRKSPGYLDEVFQNPARSRQMASMVAFLFHLVMLGIVALVASIGLGVDPGPRTVIARTGVMLLLTAIGHAATMAVLSRMRDQELSTQMAETQLAESQAAQHDRADRTATARTDRSSRTEPPRAEAPRPEKPTVESPRADAPQGEAPRAEAPREEAAQPEQPPVEAPRVEAPRVEKPRVEQPRVVKSRDALPSPRPAAAGSADGRGAR